MSQRSYPHIRVCGSARERGRQYGEAARERVAGTVQLYRDQFASDVGMKWSTARELTESFVPPIRAYAPKYLEEMQGIAEGAALDLADVLAINLRSEVKLAGWARQAAAQSAGEEPPGCTTIAITPRGSANGHTLVAQNWDWYSECENTVVVLEAEQDDGPNYVTVVEAGLLAKTGMNANGVGIVTNLLASDRDAGTPGIPYHVSLRAVLDASHAVDALARLQAPVRSASANYMVADTSGLAFVGEGLPGDYADLHLLWPGERNYLVHTNHFISPEFTGKDVGRWSIPSSPFRLQRASELISSQVGSVTPDALGQILSQHFRDPSVSICLHPPVDATRFLSYMTVASVLMDLDERQMWLAEGPPCEAGYRRIDYTALLAGENANA